MITETPYSFNASGIQDSSCKVEDIKKCLAVELNGSLELDHHGFVSSFSPENPHVAAHVDAVWKRCCLGPNALFDQSWHGWKEGNEADVQKSFERVINGIMSIVNELDIKQLKKGLRFISSPNNPLEGTPVLKPDMAVVVSVGSLSEPSWKLVVCPVEIKPPGEDMREVIWLGITKYARAVFTTQDSRRFVLAITLSGSVLRLWEFDRAGATTSPAIDIHKSGRFLVKVVLDLLCMDDESLGYDPALHATGDKCVVTIKEGDDAERLCLTATLRSYAACIVGRATTCWKAHREGHPSAEYVVKDSWQFPDRPEEGTLLQEAAKAGVEYVAPYYHHEDVYFNGKKTSSQTSATT